MICRYCWTDLSRVPELAWEVVLPLEPPSQNDVALKDRRDFMARKRYKKFRSDYGELFAHHKRGLDIPDASAKRRVIITRLYDSSGRRRDISNIIGGCKPLLDAMVDAKLLVDDTEDWLEQFYHQVKTNASGVGIRIEEL